jgi:ribonuclease HII
MAGSLVIVGVVLKNPIDGLMDSKKLSEKKREALYPLILENSNYHIVSFSSVQVDELGLSKCLHQGLLSIQKHLKNYEYLFDGNSSFGVENISTMVKADAKIAEVSAASILAKVTRDREIVAQAKIYPEYGFEKHKGYGTKAHIEALIKYDRCPIHRKTFRVKGLDDPNLF